MTFTIEVPQAIFVVLSMLGLSLSIAQHGQTREINALTTAIGLAIEYWILIAGGFFS